MRIPQIRIIKFIIIKIIYLRVITQKFSKDHNRNNLSTNLKYKKKP